MMGKLSLLALVILLSSSTAVVGAKTVTVSPGESIQSAINAASSGDSIQVKGGTYYEHIDVNKRIKLAGIGDPVIDAGGSGTAVSLSAPGCSIQGFRVVNSGPGCGDAGIEVASDNCIVESNFVTSGHHGIWLEKSDQIRVTNNIITKNENGIYLHESSQNKISGNNINENHFLGIYIEKSDNNIINKNSIYDNTEDGVYCLGPAIKNKITGNFLEGNNIGEGSAGGAAIALSSCSYGEVSGNIIRKNPKGVWLTPNSNGNEIRNNTIEGNLDTGILLQHSVENIITDNAIANNPGGGIRLEESGDNIIDGNIMKNNGDLNAFEYQCHNQWYDGVIGNYYSNYDEPGEGCIDTDNNNICDMPYQIPRVGNTPDKSIDMYPARSASWLNNINQLAALPGILKPGGTLEPGVGPKPQRQFVVSNLAKLSSKPMQVKRLKIHRLLASGD